MKILSLSLCLVLALILWALSALAQDASSEAPSGPPAKAFDSHSIVVIPMIFYTPETRWSGGAGGIYTFRPSWSKDPSRPSSLQFSGLFTQNHQFALNLKPEIYLGNSTAQLLANVDIKHYPDTFFGIGNDTLAAAAEHYAQDLLSVEVSFLKRVWPGKRIYAGLTYGGDYCRFSDFTPGGALAGGSVPGSRGGLASGLAATFKLDDRDNIFYPTRGNYLLVSADFHSAIIGSDYGYVKLKVDGRKYYSVLRNHVLAFQAVFQAGAGTVPFTALPKLGGDGILRGINGSRFRDRVLVAAQVEYRLPVWWRFKIVGFAGLGEVAGRLGRLSLAGLKYSFGLGLRFAIVPSEGTNVRFDRGFGPASSGNYFLGGEAF